MYGSYSDPIQKRCRFTGTRVGIFSKTYVSTRVWIGYFRVHPCLMSLAHPTMQSNRKRAVTHSSCFPIIRFRFEMGGTAADCRQKAGLKRRFKCPITEPILSDDDSNELKQLIRGGNAIFSGSPRKPIASDVCAHCGQLKSLRTHPRS